MSAATVLFWATLAAFAVFVSCAIDDDYRRNKKPRIDALLDQPHFDPVPARLDELLADLDDSVPLDQPITILGRRIHDANEITTAEWQHLADLGPSRDELDIIWSRVFDAVTADDNRKDAR